MKEISQQELTIIKSILIGKPPSQVIDLLNIKKTEYPKLKSIGYSIREVNWDDIKEEVILLYFNLSKESDLQPLEKRVQKKNAKLGFPIKRKRLLNTEKEFNVKITERVRIKNNREQQKLTIQTPIKIFRYYELVLILKILEIDVAKFKDLCKKAGVKFYENKRYSYLEWELLAPFLEEIRIKQITHEEDKKRIERENKQRQKQADIDRMNKGVREKFESAERKDRIQRYALSARSFGEISTGMRD